MTLRSLAFVCVASALPALALLSCKTTEENYRAAYEKAIEAQNDSTSLESTIYGAQRRRVVEATVNTAEGSVEVRRARVRVTDGTGSPDDLHQYNVVVGQFKQVFNAKSLRQRLVDKGFDKTFVVETSEPYYYIVVGSFDSAAEAQDAMNEFKTKNVITMRDELPFVLDCRIARKAQTTK